MRTKRLLWRLFLASLVVPSALASAQSNRNPSPIRWQADAHRTAQSAKPGVKLWVALHATIAPGWHLYALDQEPGGPVRTTIDLPAGQPYSLAGAVKQPDPIANVDPNFEVPVRYFEDSVVFQVPIARTSKTGSTKDPVTVRVSFQSCNDTICLPVTSVNLHVPVPSSSK